MKLAIQHETIYRYDARVHHSIQYLRLTPQSALGQRIVSWQLDTPAALTASRDAYGNVLHVLALDTPHDEIRICARGVIETGVEEAAPREALNPLLFLRSTPLTECSDAMQQYADGFRALPAAEQLPALMRDLLAHMPYTPGETDSQTPANLAFERGLGVCQDHTHVFVALARYLGWPARYVSGYLLSEGRADVASHAWAEVYVAGQWQGFDVSNQCAPGACHLKLAVGLDYLEACPIRGMRRGGGDEAMSAQACVSPADQ